MFGPKYSASKLFGKHNISHFISTISLVSIFIGHVMDCKSDCIRCSSVLLEDDRLSPLTTKISLFYSNIQLVPRSKHTQSRL